MGIDTEVAPDVVEGVRVGPVDPGPPRRWPTWCRILLAAVMMLVAALSVVLPALIPGAREWGASLSGWPLVGFAALQYAIPTVVAALLVWAAMRLVDRRPMAHTGWRFDARSLPALALATVITVALTLVAGFAADLVGPPRPAPSGEGLSPAMSVVLRGVLMGYLMQGIPEELVWRGYVLQTLRMPAAVSVYISAVGFALLHLLSGGGQENAVERVIYLGPPFAFALLAGALVLRTHSLWAAFGVHGGSHLGNAIGSTYFGLGEGPAVWIAQTVAYLVVALPLLHHHGRARERDAARVAEAHRYDTPHA